MSNIKREITNDEIEYLIDFITPNLGIPKDVTNSVVAVTKNKFRKQLQGLLIYPKILPKLKLKMESSYVNTLVQYGENVGILTAQSFGQFQTQSTLNSFHKAGMAEKTVVTGVPRFSEILAATTSPKGSCCIIYFIQGTDTLQNLRKTIGSSIAEFKLKKLCDKMSYVLDKKDEKWYESFKILYNSNFSEHSHCVSITINQKLVYEYSITLEQIAKKIEDTYADLFCVFSPLSEGRIDIYVDISNIDMPEEKLVYVEKDHILDAYFEEVVIPKLESLSICGIEGISNIFFCNEKDYWYIETEGTNFSDVLAHPMVDMKKTMTNDMWEIYYTLGIEAVRQYLIEELGNIMAGINPCHSKLLVDKMTHNGLISSISRYAMRGEGSGALSKASFEETLDNLLTAAVRGECEETSGVSASIICGKLGKFGTGCFDLRINLDTLMEKNVIGNVIEN